MREGTALIERRICDLAEALLAAFVPCHIRAGTCRTGRLLGEGGVPCCQGRHLPNGVCPDLGPRGCQRVNVRCRLWLCEGVLRQAEPEFVEAMLGLERAARALGLSQRPYLGERYVGRGAEVAALVLRGGRDDG